MAFNNIKQAEVDEPTEQRDSQFLTKEELVGAIIAIDVVDYDPAYEGNYGPNPRITVDMIVCSGPHKGRREDSKYFSNNLAKQLHKAAGGEGSTIVKVVSGNGKRGTWFGVDAVQGDEFDAAVKFVQDALSQSVKAPF